MLSQTGSTSVAQYKARVTGCRRARLAPLRADLFTQTSTRVMALLGTKRVSTQRANIFRQTLYRLVTIAVRAKWTGVLPGRPGRHKSVGPQPRRPGPLRVRRETALRFLSAFSWSANGMSCSPPPASQPAVSKTLSERASETGVSGSR
jgi:hypothetical protein